MNPMVESVNRNPAFANPSHIGLLRKWGSPDPMLHPNHMPQKWLANPPESQGRVGSLTDFVMILVLLGLRVHTPENKHDIGNSPFSTGNASSNSGCSIVMLVFLGGHVYMNSWENHWLESAKHPGKDGWDNFQYQNLLQNITVGFFFQNPGGQSHCSRCGFFSGESHNLLPGDQMIGDSMMAKSATKAWHLAWLEKSEPQRISSIYLTHRTMGWYIYRIWLIFLW